MTMTVDDARVGFQEVMAAQSADPTQIADEAGNTDKAFLLDILPKRMRFAAKHSQTEPKISVFLPARNEGKQVVKTIENMWACGADDVTVIDDASEDGSCDSRTLPSEVQIVRHNEASGCGYGRFDGMGCSDGDVCVTADAHVRGPEGCLKEMAKVAIERRAIVAPAITSMKNPGDWTIYGGALEYQPKRGCFEHYCFGDKPQGDPVSPITCLYGSIYVFPKYVVKRMGRVSKTTAWGYNEMAHTIRALLCDVPLFVDSRYVFEHRYKLRPQGRVTSARISNFFWAAFVLFERETYEETMRPVLLDRFKAQIQFDITEIESNPVILAEREAFRAHKVWTDEDFLLYVARHQLSAQGRKRITVSVEKEGM